ncbi:NTF2 [Symbiodinium sp. KB8]|nr:NTF2 [Symbiodinium sp. KB8]
MAAQTEPVKSPAQQLAETTWSNYAGLLCKGDAGILSLYTANALACADGEVAEGQAGITALLQKKLSGGAPTFSSISVAGTGVASSGGVLVLIAGEMVVGTNTGRFNQVLYMVPDAKVAGGAGIQLDFFRTAATTGVTAELNPVPAGKVVGEFVMSYYEALKSNQSALQSAYRDSSQLTVDGVEITGGTKILEQVSKFLGSTFEVQTIDILPGAADGSMFIGFVCGVFIIKGETNPLLFCRVVGVTQDSAGLYLANDMFRINYS